MAFVRIISNPAFSPEALAPADALGLLERNLAHPRHDFWPDAIGLAEAVGPVAPRLQGYRQIADAYLLGLALERRGTLASFDRGVRALATGERAAVLAVVPTAPAARPRP
jgi:predicted nucleic acid-binding protein